MPLLARILAVCLKAAKFPQPKSAALFDRSCGIDIKGVYRRLVVLWQESVIIVMYYRAIRDEISGF